jgi:hypothetical protein
MRSITFTQRQSFALKALYLLLATVTLYAMFYQRAYDDPFITYRYADNLSTGAGFVYNRNPIQSASERVQSTTTPLFTLLLALLAPVWGDLPHLAILIGVISLAAGALLLWELAAEWKASWSGWAGLLLYPLFPLAVTPLGSETPLYIAFCLGAYAAYTRKSYRVTAACAALATLTRPDGLLVALILGIDFTIRYFKRPASTPIPWAAILIFLGLLLPWFVFAWVYFGSPLPATLAAKQQQGAMAVSQRFAQGFLTTLGWYKSWRYVLEGVLALLGLAYVIRRARRWLLFLAWPGLYFVAYSILGVSRYFWYYTPLVPGFLMLAGLGLQAIAPLQWTNLSAWQKYFAWVPVLARKTLIQLGPTLVGCILGVLCLAQAGGLVRLRQPDVRYSIYRAAGEWLAAYTPQEAVIGALEVGILGYYARRPMVDFAGLIQPGVASQLAVGGNYDQAAMWAAARYQLQYLVLFPGDFPQLEQEYVARRCHLKVTFSVPKDSLERDLAVYACR